MIEIVAEAANGHEGDPQRMRLLIALAAAAGADAVKFQMVFSAEIFTRDHPLYERFRSEEVADQEWAAAVATAHDAGCQLFVDVFGPRSAALAEQIGADAIKIHATDVTNHALLETVAGLSGGRVVLGIGGAFRDEIADALGLLAGKQVILLHGFQAYPTRIEDNQIARMLDLRACFPGFPVGFADHVPLGDPRGMWLPATAVGAGATMIEKHLTLAAALRGADHEAALGPDEFADFVRNMRDAEAAMGPVPSGTVAPDFGMTEAERDYRARVRKSLVAARDLGRGHILTVADVTLRRSPRDEAVALDPSEAVGRALLADLEADQPIAPDLLAASDATPAGG
jgi:N,N'-diacetyllegionaminate synthase